MIYEAASTYKEADIFEREMPRYLSHSPSVRNADQEREALPITSDQKGALSIARRRKR
jgi:hypothetical protein